MNSIPLHAPDEWSIGLPLALQLIILVGVWVYYERRSRGRRESLRASVFRCERCRRVYLSDSGLPRIACPSCGTYNDTTLN